jgi:hypothetical protein
MEERQREDRRRRRVGQKVVEHQMGDRRRGAFHRLLVWEAKYSVSIFLDTDIIGGWLTGRPPGGGGGEPCGLPGGGPYIYVNPNS